MVLPLQRHARGAGANCTGGQIDILFQTVIVDSATKGPLFHSNYDSEKLALLFRLMNRKQKYSTIIKELYSDSKSSFTEPQKNALTNLFWDCLRHFGMETFACINIPAGKLTPSKLAEFNPISFCTKIIAPVITPNSENLSFNFGLVLHLHRHVDTMLTQNVYIQVQDPKHMQGISLYYNFSVLDNDPDTLAKCQVDPKFGTEYSIRKPSYMIRQWEKNDPEHLQVFENLETRGITVVAEEPIKITTDKIQQRLLPNKWLSDTIIDWWLKYWCAKLPDTTFYSGSNAISKERNRTERDNGTEEAAKTPTEKAMLSQAVRFALAAFDQLSLKKRLDSMGPDAGEE
jgi:hypothetical protein